MRALLTLVHLLLSAAIASGAGGLLLTGLLGVSGLAAMLAGDPAGAVRALPEALVFLLVFAGVAVAGTIPLAILPAALVGGLLRRRARLVPGLERAGPGLRAERRSLSPSSSGRRAG